MKNNGLRVKRVRGAKPRACRPASASWVIAGPSISAAFAGPTRFQSGSSPGLLPHVLKRGGGPTIEKPTVTPRRPTNAAVRPREYLTGEEIRHLLKTARTRSGAK